MRAAVRNFVKRVTGLHPQSGVRPLRGLRRIGSHLHHYQVPEHLLDANSICYCIGAGEDISFDVELKTLYDCRVYIFDPTPYGIDHFEKLKAFTASGRPLSLPDQGGHAYVYDITPQQLATIEYVPVGVWNEKTVLVFRDPQKQHYPSYSVCFFADSEKTIQAPVDRLGNLMKAQGHAAIDLVKIEIEGAEYAVIDTIVEDALDIKVILVEFDEVYNSKGRGYHLRIKRSTDKLIRAGYVLVHSSELLKRTFVREDVYERLKALERA